MTRINILLFATLLLTSAVFAQNSASTAETGNPTRTELIEQINDYFEDDRFQNAFWGAVIESLDTGEVWYERNAEKMFMPASNEKIITTAAALTALGPEWRFTTTVTTDGEIEDGTLKGDLMVTGNGDPTLYERFYDSTTQVFEEWADELKEQGIERIDGDVIGNDNKWEDTHYDGNWAFDGVVYWYYAEYGPLTLNENYVDVRVIPPDTVDGEVVLEPNIESAYFELVNNVRVVEEGRNYVSVHRDIGSNKLIFSGQVRAGSDSSEESPTITNPTMFYVTVLTETLEKKGIQVTGGPVDIDEIAKNRQPKGEKVLIEHKSAPLAEIIQGLMKRSQNMYAETMVRVLGEQKGEIGSFREGRRVLQEQLESLGVDSDGYQFRDGSGLSRYNFVSPRALTEILKALHEHEYSQAWIESMPIAGVDGTLRRRMKGTPAEGNVRAKTGTISNVRGLSGYVTTADGEEIVFSFLVNAHMVSSRDTDDVTDGALALIAGYESEEE